MGCRHLQHLTLYHWLAISLALHLFAAAPFYVLTHVRMPDHRHSRNRLVVELFGMIADRQTEARKEGTRAVRDTVSRPRIVPRQQVRRSAVKRPPEKDKTPAVESPVLVEKRDDKPAPAEQPGGPSVVSGASSAGTAGGDAGGLQRTIGRVDQAADRMRAYTARLTKRLRANLVYPEEMRKSGIEAVSTIRFTITESGAIREGSLRVTKSSGHAALDKNALRSALASAPFEKPPRELNVSITVAFTVDMAASRPKRVSQHRQGRRGEREGMSV